MDTEDKPAVPMIDRSAELVTHIAYTNHRGEFSIRKITPLHLYFGVSRWHQGAQWFLSAFCHKHQAKRDFAMRDIAKWDVQDG